MPDYQVSSSGGDSHQQSIANDSGRAVSGSGTCLTNAARLEVGSHSSGNEWSAAVRFTGVAVANGATISSATFSLKADASYNAAPNVVKMYISAEDSDNAAALSTTGGDLNASGRPRTTATVVATVTSITGGNWYDFDVTAVIQEVVDRAGWASGNALVILLDTHEDTTVNEWQDWRAYDTAPADAPKISITVGSGGTTYTETGSGVTGWTSGGADQKTSVDAGGGSFQGIGLAADVKVSADVGAVVGAWVASGDAFKVFSESGAAIMTGAAGGVDVKVSADAGAGAGAWAIGGADVVVLIDTGADVFEGVAGGAESYTPGGGGGTVYTESGAAIFTMVAGGADVWVGADAGAAIMTGAVGGADRGVSVDSGAGVLSGAAGGADRGVAPDGGVVVFEMVASGDAFTPAVGYVKPFRVRGGGVTAAQSTPRTRGGGVKVS